MKKIKELVEKFGLDRTVIGGFRIIAIDMEKLLSCKNVTVDRDGDYKYFVNGSSFRWLKIEDLNIFGVFVAGTRINRNMKQDFARIDIPVGNREQGNLHNMTVSEYKMKIQQVFEYLQVKYGIKVDLQNLKFKQMEINCTFLISDEFYKYHRVLDLLMFNLPDSFKKIGRVSDVNKKIKCLETETYYRSNSSFGIKIYDKKKQLEQTVGYVPEGNVMRVELELKSTQKIKETFGSALVSDLTDEKVYEFYYKQFVRLFEKPYKKWQQENQKQLKNMIQAHKSENRTFWIRNLIRDCSNQEQKNQIPVLLDVQDLLVPVKELDTNRHYKRTEKGIKEHCLKEDVFVQGDSEKVVEIIDKIRSIYEKYKNSSEP